MSIRQSAGSFVERIRREIQAGVAEILNLQPRGSLAKPYQVKQVRAVIARYVQ
jgi:hypothetical protein